MNGKKKLRKRITAFLMTLVMVMTLVMSVEPMEVRAAYTRNYTPGTPMVFNDGDNASKIYKGAGNYFFVKFTSDTPTVKADDDTYTFSGTKIREGKKDSFTLSNGAGTYVVFSNMSGVGQGHVMSVCYVTPYTVTFKYSNGGTEEKNYISISILIIIITL